VTAPDPRAGTLRKSDLAVDPFEQFALWLGDAETAGIGLAEAMTLATATRDGKPSARMVLLKEHGPEGFVFFTGYRSRKGRELDENPHATLVFYWHELGRQVRVEGTVERLSREESKAYFDTRPVGSRLAAWASPQSQPVPSREALDALYAEAAAAYGDGDVPLPPDWGGFRLRPSEIEFWQHHTNRLHDRFRYGLDDVVWVVERLGP
jgi:pyridoxamine 5'-phosphate oxidase